MHDIYVRINGLNKREGELFVKIFSKRLDKNNHKRSNQGSQSNKVIETVCRISIG